jgi:predicted O-methyltransferase YrrM
MYSIIDSKAQRVHSKKNRELLCQLLRKCCFRNGAEIGVDSGIHAKMLLEMVSLDILYCVDSWARPDENKHNRFERTKARLRSFGERCVLIKMDSIEAAKTIRDGTLDFVYIDAGHLFDEVVTDVKVWLPKVKKGGILCGHDYVNVPGYCEVATAVTSLLPESDIHTTPDSLWPEWWYYVK